MIRKILFLTVICIGFSGITQASPLRLDYGVNDIGGGLFDYEFSLVLDNNDSSWVSGQGWRWLIFGDASNSPSPLTDFVGDTNDLPIGPWTSFTTSGGGHNGPTLSSVLDYWIPSSIDDSLNWSGTSTANLIQGELLFSTINGTLNGAIAADFQVANRIPSAIPVPAAIWLFGTGILGLIGFSKRGKAA